MRGYAEKTPSQRGRKVAFEHLQRTAGRMSSAALFEHVGQNFKFVNNGASEWEMDERNYDALPDAYLVFSSPDDTSVDWRSIAVSGAYYNIDGATCIENVRVLFSIAYIAHKCTTSEHHQSDSLYVVMHAP